MLHFDGLVDSADGLLPPLDRGRRLAVMADPDVGAFGVAAGAAVLSAALGGLAALRPGVLLVAGSVVPVPHGDGGRGPDASPTCAARPAWPRHSQPEPGRASRGEGRRRSLLLGAGVALAAACCWSWRLGPGAASRRRPRWPAPSWSWSWPAAASAATPGMCSGRAASWPRPPGWSWRRPGGERPALPPGGSGAHRPALAASEPSASPADWLLGEPPAGVASGGGVRPGDAAAGRAGGYADPAGPGPLYAAGRYRRRPPPAALAARPGRAAAGAGPAARRPLGHRAAVAAAVATYVAVAGAGPRRGGQARGRPRGG